MVDACGVETNSSFTLLVIYCNCYSRSFPLFQATRNTGKSIAGKNIANPTAMLLAGCMMLDHLKYVPELFLLP